MRTHRQNHPEPGSLPRRQGHIRGTDTRGNACAAGPIPALTALWVVSVSGPQWVRTRVRRACRQSGEPELGGLCGNTACLPGVAWEVARC